MEHLVAHPGITRAASRSSILRRPAAAAAAGIDEAAHRGDQRAEVQRSGGEGAKRRHSLGWRRMGARSSSRALAIAVVAVAVLALAPFSALLASMLRWRRDVLPGA